MFQYIGVKFGIALPIFIILSFVVFVVFYKILVDDSYISKSFHIVHSLTLTFVVLFIPVYFTFVVFPSHEDYTQSIIYAENNRLFNQNVVVFNEETTKFSKIKLEKEHYLVLEDDSLEDIKNKLTMVLGSKIPKEILTSSDEDLIYGYGDIQTNKRYLSKNNKPVKFLAKFYKGDKYHNANEPFYLVEIEGDFKFGQIEDLDILEF